MAQTENNPTTEEILQGLAAVFNPKKSKKAPKRDRILTIDGNIANEFVSMKEAKKVAKRLATTDVVIKVYSLEGTLSTDLTVEVN